MTARSPILLVDRLIYKQIVPMFGVGLGLCAVIFFLVGPLSQIAQYAGIFHDPWLVLKMVLLNIPAILGFSFPIAILLAVLIGYGEMATEGHGIALAAGGVSFARMVRPALCLGLVAAVAAFVIMNDYAGRANQQIAVMKTGMLSSGMEGPLDLPPKREGGRLIASFHAEKGLDAKTGTLKDLTITTYNAAGAPDILFFARSARWMGDPGFLKWKLSKVSVNTMGAGSAYTHVGSGSLDLFKVVPAPQISPKLAALLEINLQNLSFADLDYVSRSLRSGPRQDLARARAAELQMWDLIALPLASVVFAVIAAPLAMRPRRGGTSNGWSVAVIVVLVYYVLSTFGKSLALSGVLSPLPAAFLPDLVGVAVGFWLCRQISYRNMA